MRLKFVFALTAIALGLSVACSEQGAAQDEAATPAQPAPAPAGPVTAGVNHIGLTVKDLEASTGFFVDRLGWRVAGGVADYPATFVTDGELFVTLWRATDPETATDFNRKTNVGLHHLALTVRDVETLNELHEAFKADPSVRIEFGPELNGGGPTVHMMVYEPSGNRIEFAVPGGRKRGQ